MDCRNYEPVGYPTTSGALDGISFDSLRRVHIKNRALRHGWLNCILASKAHCKLSIFIK